MASSVTYPYIYLASQSPRRQELLQQLGVRFELLLPRPDEDAEALEATLPGENAADSPAFGRDRARAEDLCTLAAPGAHPAVSLFLAASRQDGGTADDARALAAAAGPGVTATMHLADSGGHSWRVWAGLAARGLDWLGPQQAD